MRLGSGCPFCTSTRSHHSPGASIATVEGLKWRSGAHVSLSLSLSHFFSKCSRFIYFKLACRQIEPPCLGRLSSTVTLYFPSASWRCMLWDVLGGLWRSCKHSAQLSSILLLLVAIERWNGNWSQWRGFTTSSSLSLQNRGEIEATFTVEVEGTCWIEAVIHVLSSRCRSRLLSKLVSVSLELECEIHMSVFCPALNTVDPGIGVLRVCNCLE